MAGEEEIAHEIHICFGLSLGATENSKKNFVNYCIDVDKFNDYLNEDLAEYVLEKVKVFTVNNLKAVDRISGSSLTNLLRDRRVYFREKTGRNFADAPFQCIQELRTSFDGERTLT